MVERLTAGVIGVGSMGFNHARVIAQRASIELVGIADVNADRASQVAEIFQTTAYPNIAALLGKVKPDLIAIAVPTRHHLDTASQAIEAGCHVLVEKPIARTPAEGHDLVNLAASNGVILTVGHIERFNPAVRALKSRLEQDQAGRIFQIVVRRLGPLPDRIDDVGVALDLATHDVDILRYLVNSEMSSYSAEICRHMHQHEDLLAALISFENGVIGILQENWLSPTKLRDITINGERGMFVADLVNQNLQIYENNSMSYDGIFTDIDGMSVGNSIQYHFIREEPLRLQLASFENAVRTNTLPLVSGNDGVRAVEVAQSLVQSANSS